MKDLVVALTLTLLVQALVSATVYAPAVLAPVAQGDAGVAASSIGIFTALIYGVAALSAPLGGTFIARHGALRVSQYCLLLSGSGLALCAFAHPAALIAGALLIGCGYGPVTPASSEILIARSPERLRNLIISIRQAGVPAGGALAGAVVPVLLLAGGWKSAVLAIATFNIVFALALQTVRNRYDGGRHAASAAPRPSLTSLLRMVFAHAELRQGALASFMYAGIQMCLASFLVVFLIERADVTLVNAGFALAVAMIGGIVGRVLWGSVADYLGGARIVLGGLGVVMALSAFTVSQVTAEWPLLAVFTLCAVFGLTAVGWNGVFVAEVARVAPGGNVALATGATLGFTYLGVVVAPFGFWLILTLSGSYTPAFIVVGAVTLVAALSYFGKPASSRAAV
jgi:MFS family permease